MLNDKNLARLLQTTAKHGLQYRERDGVVEMIGAGWALQTEMILLQEEGRKTLSKFVEMIGDIPTDCCIEIKKGKDDYIVQGLNEETFAEELAYRSTLETAEICKPTKMSWQGMRLLQAESRAVVGVAPGTMYLLDGGFLIVDEQFKRVQCSDHSSVLSLAANRPDMLSGDSIEQIWTALEGLNLADWEETAQETPDENQMQMEDLEA